MPVPDTPPSADAPAEAPTDALMAPPVAPSAATPATPAARAAAWVRALWSLGLALLAAGLGALAWLSYVGFTLRCEGFGCMGRGIVWAGWCGLWLGVLFLSLLLGWSAAHAAPRAWQRVPGWASTGLLLAAAGHLLVWVLH